MAEKFKDNLNNGNEDEHKTPGSDGPVNFNPKTKKSDFSIYQSPPSGEKTVRAIEEQVKRDEVLYNKYTSGPIGTILQAEYEITNSKAEMQDVDNNLEKLDKEEDEQKIITATEESKEKKEELSEKIKKLQEKIKNIIKLN